MIKYHYYKKTNKRKFIRISHLISLIILCSGLIGFFYVFFPLISWQIFFNPFFTSQDITAPIPKTTIVNSLTIKSLFAQAASETIKRTDYENLENWFPGYKIQKSNSNIESYFLSIPKLNIKNATVSTIDNKLSEHLVNYGGTAIPPNNGNIVIFGHSTLPQLFNPKDYKTIFANLHKMKVEDKVFIDISGITYLYKVFSITVVEPENTSVFTQDYNQNFLTLITCTPPGTTWKRLIIKAKLEKV